MFFQMIKNKITSSIYYNYRLKRMDTKLNYPTNQNSIKVPKVVEPTNKRTIIIELWGLV